MVPRVASGRFFVSEAIQSAHVGLVEFFRVLGLEIIPDKGEVECRIGALSHQIHPIKIADAIVVD